MKFIRCDQLGCKGCCQVHQKTDKKRFKSIGKKPARFIRITGDRFCWVEIEKDKL